jgi:hypothetical protein
LKQCAPIAPMIAGANILLNASSAMAAAKNTKKHRVSGNPKNILKIWKQL